MAFVINDRCQQTTTTTGTGTISFDASVPSGFQGFVAGIGSGNITNYCIFDGVNWETGVGTVTAGGADTLSRTTVLQSSNADALVNFSAGVKTVICVISAGKSLYKNDAGTIQGVPTGTFSPRIGGSSADGTGHVYSSQGGLYQRIGPFINFSVDLAVTTVGTGMSGALRIRDMPFSSDANFQIAASVGKVTAPANAMHLMFQVSVSDSVMAGIWSYTNNSAITELQVTEIASGFTLRATGLYRTAAA